MQIQSLGWEDPLEKGMATHSSILAWRIPWTEEPGGLQSVGLQSRTQLKWLSTHANWFKYFLGSDSFEKLIKALEGFPASLETHRTFSIRHWAL